MKNKLISYTITLFILLNIINAQTWETFSTANSDLPSDIVSSIEISTDGTVWFATDNGLAAYKDGNWSIYSTDSGLSDNHLNSVLFQPLISNQLWITTNMGVTKFEVDAANVVADPSYINKENDHIVSDTVITFGLDSFSNSWVGTDKGLSVLTNSGIYNYTETSGLEHSYVNAIEVLTDNWVHIATNGGGVSRLKYNGVDGISSASRIENSWSALPSDTVLTVYVTDDTLYWYGTTAGVATFHGKDSKIIYDDNNKPINWWVYNTFTSGIIDNYVRAVTRDNSGSMWFGTRKGISMMSVTDSSWISYNEDDGLVSNNIFDIQVDSDNNLWIATDKGVSYLSDLPTSVQNKEAITYKISLTNYPNPFNPETNIDYTIPKASNVTLEVYDILGRIVETLVDKKQNAGNYQVLFNANNIPSGIYFYRITTEQSSVTQKMVLLK